MENGRIHVGVGGWTFEPWRDNFYPKGLPHARELHYASRQLTAIEINGTYYSTYKPAQFAKWRDETPHGFVFTVKANRFATNRKVLASAGDAIDRFVHSGLSQLGPKLGPLLWQFMATKQFMAEDFEAFLRLLPKELEGVPLTHALEPRHPSFDCDEYLALARRYGCVTVHTDSPQFPNLVDAESDTAYLRLMRSSADCETGYPLEVLDQWAVGARAWRDKGPAKHAYMFFINGSKERAPNAAMALIRRLG
jgi:uncharacterized protein YecE (DUF72 family)